jgi:hypothetical protein
MSQQATKAVFFKLWCLDHWWSVAVHRVVCSGQQAVLEEKALQTLCQLLNE